MARVRFRSPSPLGCPKTHPSYGPPLSLEKARKVMAAAEAEANAHGWPMAIAIFDSQGVLKLLQRLDDANLGAVALAQRKAESALLFRAPTQVFEEILISGAQGSRMLTLGPELLPLGGGVPLLEGGAVIGSIGVSGMQPSQDGQVASAGARSLEG
jgi:glc operon protein GlcG